MLGVALIVRLSTPASRNAGTAIAVIVDVGG
jgi:hypothetical protein